MCVCKVESCVVPSKNDGEPVGDKGDGDSKTDVEGEEREAKVANGFHEYLSEHEEEVREEDRGEGFGGEEEEQGWGEEREDKGEREEKTDRGSKGGD